MSGLAPRAAALSATTEIRFQGLFSLTPGNRRGRASHATGACCVEDALPQFELPDPERVQEVRRRDPLRHLAGRRWRVRAKPARRVGCWVFSAARKASKMALTWAATSARSGSSLLAWVAGTSAQIASVAAATRASKIGRAHV